MNRYWTYLLVLVLVLAIGLMVSCGDDDDIQEPEPEFTADFFIYETLPIALPEGWEYIDTDTVLTNHVIFSAAYEGAATYEWQLGAETISDRSFSRWGFPRGEVIEVSLKVTKTVGDSVMIDSLTRYFYTIEDECGELDYHDGLYEGYFDGNEEEIKTIGFERCHIEDMTADPDPLFKWQKVTNLVDECSVYFRQSFRASKQLRLSEPPTLGPDCQLYLGYVRFRESNQIELDIVLWSGENVGQNLKFYGTKIQN